MSAATAEIGQIEAIREAAERIRSAGESSRRPGLYPVNGPMIDHWISALESGRPASKIIEDDVSSTAEGDQTAPPAMIQVWTMPGLRARFGDDDPLHSMMGVLDRAGYTSVVATNCEQTYLRPLTVGEQVSVSAALGEVTGPKRTALGVGWFVTTRSTWFVDDEPVAEMMFRVLKFRPPEKVVPQSDPLRPAISRDTAFFWAGTAVHELRIQRCEDCGTLRHPPGPRCMACGSADRGYQLALGTGTIFSYVVHHHPPVSGRTAPFVVALIELSEGVRMLGELIGVDPLDPDAIRIGAPVEVGWQRVDDGLTLPTWQLVPSGDVR
jgi:uncharacterized OB-fold protein